MLFRMKDEKAHQLEAELDKLQADGPAAWAKLPEEELFTPAGFSEDRKQVHLSEVQTIHFSSHPASM